MDNVLATEPHVIALLACTLWIAAQAAVPEVARQSAASLKLIKTIAMPKVEGRIDHLGYDSDTNMLFVAARNNGTVELIGLGSGRVYEPWTWPQEAQGVAFMEGVGHVAVTDGQRGWLMILDSVFTSGFGLDEAPVGGFIGEDADNVRYLPKSQHLLVGYGSGALGIVELEEAVAPKGTTRKFDGRFRVLHSIPLVGHPESFQVDAAEKRAWVNVPSASSIVMVDLERRIVARTIELESVKQNFPMALAEEEKRLFVGCRDPAKLLIFDLDGSLLAQLPLGGDVDDIFVDPDRNLVYASCGEGTLDVFEQSPFGAWRPKERIPTAAGARTCLFVPTLKELFVAVPGRGSTSAEIRVLSTSP